MSVLPSLNSIKTGITILRDGEPYEVLEARFIRMQQRKPVMQTKLRHLGTQKILEYSFKPGETVEEADVEKRKASLLYTDSKGLHFMDQTTFEEFTYASDKLNFRAKLLKDGTEVTVVLLGERILALELPKKVELTVTNAPPGVRGDSAQGSVTKIAETETGYNVNVPLFINEGDVIRINTDTGEYVERA